MMIVLSHRWDFICRCAVFDGYETAKANGLSVFTYLEYLLMYMPDVDYQNDPEALADLMPWSESVKAVCGK
jgi:hypothetical protein